MKEQTGEEIVFDRGGNEPLLPSVKAAAPTVSAISCGSKCFGERISKCTVTAAASDGASDGATDQLIEQVIEQVQQQVME